jgi:hypothetical protein
MFDVGRRAYYRVTRDNICNSERLRCRFVVRTQGFIIAKGGGRGGALCVI